MKYSFSEAEKEDLDYTVKVESKSNGVEIMTHGCSFARFYLRSPSYAVHPKLL